MSKIWINDRLRSVSFRWGFGSSFTYDIQLIYYNQSSSLIFPIPIKAFANSFVLELQQTFGVPWGHILILSFLQPLVPFLKFFSKYHILWVKMNDNNNCPFYNHFWPFFRQLYVYLSQKGGSDGHFEVLNGSKYWLVQELWPQM